MKRKGTDKRVDQLVPNKRIHTRQNMHINISTPDTLQPHSYVAKLFHNLGSIHRSDAGLDGLLHELFNLGMLVCVDCVKCVLLVGGVWCV